MLESHLRDRRVLVVACLGVLVAGGVVVARAAGPAPTPPAPPVDATWPAATDTAPAPDTVGAIVVHVSGAVAQPGVYRLAAGSRVTDAIDAAGGVTDVARPADLNLAAPLADGVRVHVPTTSDPATAPAAGVSGGVPGVVAAVAPIDLNTADATALDTLPGIGPVLAARIVADREANGPFATVADLDRVPGVGPATVAELEGLVTA